MIEIVKDGKTVIIRGDTDVPPEYEYGNTGVPPEDMYGDTDVPPEYEYRNTGVPPEDMYGDTDVPPEYKYGNTGIPPEDMYGEKGIPPEVFIEEEKSFFDKNLDESDFADKNTCNEPELVRGVMYDEPELVRGVTYDEPELVRGVMYDELSVKEDVTSDRVSCSDDVATKVVTSTSLHQQEGTSLMTQYRTNFTDSENAMLTEVVIGEPVETVNLNFALRLIKTRVFVSDTVEGETYSYEYVIAITIQKLDGSLRTFVANVPSHKVKGTDWLKTSTFCLAKIPSNKAEKEVYEGIVQKCIEEENVPSEIIFPTAGWRNIKNLGNRFVYADGIVGEKNSLIHTSGSQNTLTVNEAEICSSKTFADAINMGNICKNSSASAELLLFVHASMISTLFENAGFPVNFVFGIVGITNSRKTSMATAMAQVFDRQTLKAHAEFATSTSCGIEKILGTYKDGITIIDDFKPGANPAQSREMIKKLDEFVRLTGNRVAKVRMTEFMPSADKKFFPITSSCVCTMELVQGVTSTISRMFITEIDAESVDNELLAYFQKEKWILPTHMYAFLSWVTKNYEMVESYISSRFPKLRGCKKFAYGRYAEMYATLMVSAEILARYAYDKMFWGENQKTDFLNKTDWMLAHELQLMGEKATRRDKTDIVKRAIQDAFLYGKIKTIHLTPENASLNSEAYEDDMKVYARSGYIKKVVNDFCIANYEIFRIEGNEEIIDLLEKSNLLDIASTARGKERARKLPVQKGNSLRYLHLKKEEISKLFVE